MSGAIGPWLLVLALGVYHGINPGMGWLLAVSNGMQARRGSAVLLALGPIGAGHFLAMAAALLPFALLTAYVSQIRLIGLACGLALIGFGLYKLIRKRHPRWLARIKPAHLLLWSFLMATAHGAGLMLLPVYLRLCGPAPADAAHAAMMTLLRQDLGTALLVAAVHTAAMLTTGGIIAWLVYRYWGLRALRQSWFNLDLLWSVMLLGSGALATWAAAR